jgi:Transport and Golgi organisation 2
MCTVSAIPGGWLHPGFGSTTRSSALELPLLRVVCNRDELRTRARALPPSILDLGPRRAVLPVDPDGGGSWIAANDAGLVFALLNVTRDPGARGTFSRSRGEVVRSVAGASGLDEVWAALQTIDASEYLPFRLLAWSVRDVLEAVSEGHGYRVAHGPLYAPMLRTSSSLGDARVMGLREALFERLLGQTLTPAAQDAFHHHTWSERPEVSVFMSRPDARTVSVTTIEVYGDRIEMIYQDVDAPLSSSHTLRIAAPQAPPAPVAVDAPVAPRTPIEFAPA